MVHDLVWADSLALDIQHGYLAASHEAPRTDHPRVVLNEGGASALRALRDELPRATAFTFSVAFVTPNAIALLKQEFKDFAGQGRIITSDYLGFNSPAAFAELLNLKHLFGFDVRLHLDSGFHPKGYIFERPDAVTAMVGSSNLTGNALTTNHEWNLKVTAARGSDLGEQFLRLSGSQLTDSTPLTQEWLDVYTRQYVAPSARPRRVLPTPDLVSKTPGTSADDRSSSVRPNLMQVDALEAIAEVRNAGAKRAVIISATGTGKTILSALDVAAVNPERLLFVVHREQILDRTIEEYRKVLGGDPTDYGKLSGSSKQTDARYLFATVQTLAQQHVLESFDSLAFDYLIIDEAHRAGAASHLRVIDHFKPAFLLGMTATPERMDDFNVFELFDYVVPYEIRLTHALESNMLSPFHYYGVADVTYEDGTTADGTTERVSLASPERVSHLVDALETYGQAGLQPCGLIFGSSRPEIQALSAELNRRTFRGRLLRTLALTGLDDIPSRQAAVRRLESGDLDYILTVDVFNEGVDIPTLNQIVMLRQTESAIVFVQQLGRGLRKAAGKDYLVVIDVIGNYANNYMIPIALFGDESLNKESLRKNLIAAEETGVVPGLSSVRFDQISRQRVLDSIGTASLDSMPRLKAALASMRNRVGGTPTLWDFYRFESVDPLLLATKKEHFLALLVSTLGIAHDLTPTQTRSLGLVSHEVFTAKRIHEFVVLRTLLDEGPASPERLVTACHQAGADFTPSSTLQSVLDTLTLVQHSEVDQNRYRAGIAGQHPDGTISLTSAFLDSYTGNATFAAAVDDILRTGRALVTDRYRLDQPFTPGLQYGRKEVTRLLSMPRKWTSTLYGYKVDKTSAVCPIFVTLHKGDDVTASTAYEDAIVDPTTMVWYTKSRRTLSSPVERAIANNEYTLHVFVKKDDAEGKDFYYLGEATAQDAVNTTMAGKDGKVLDVVKMELRFATPMNTALYDYFHPTLTATV